MPVKIFVASAFGLWPRVRLLDPEQKGAAARAVLYKKLPADFAITSFEKVDAMNECDFVLLPQSVRKITPVWQEYFESIRKSATAAGKEVIVFLGSDLAFRMHVEGAIVFKASEFARDKRPNEIIFAPFVEDLGEGRERKIRTKSAKPVVSFCGYAGFPNLRTRCKFHLKNLALDLAALVSRDPRHQVYKRGIYFRRAAIRALSGDSRVSPSFIIRDSFAGNVRTAAIDPARARKEYIDNMLDSDFVLCPKGDGNYSSRFFESLALGRIPILVDTDMELPFESRIDYSKFIIRVPFTDLAQIGDHIMNRWQSLTDESYATMQEKAREAFRSSLRYDSFFNTALPLLCDGGVAAFKPL